MPLKELRGLTAIVTGAAKRIGREVALELGSEGVNVVIHYSGSEDDAKSLKAELDAKGVKAWTLQADFSKGGYDGFIERALGLAGKVDILVNNASIFPRNTLDEITFEGLVANIQINAWAPFVLSRDFAGLIKKGKIINMLDSRLSGYDWTHVEYILSKHVFAELTKMTAVQYAPDITVNGVNPGLILPPPGKDQSYLEKLNSTVPLKKHGNTQEIAAAILYLLKTEFLTGEVINVDGGRHIMEYGRGPHPD